MIPRHVAPILVSLLALLGGACSVDTGALAPEGDSSVRMVPLDAAGDSDIPIDSAHADSSVTDSSVTDSSVTDSSAMDSSAMDSSTVDSGAPPDATPDAPPACPEAEARCAVGDLERCIGGVYVAEASCSLGCSDVGGAHCMELVPSNVDASLFVATGDVHIIAPTTWNTNGCESTPLPGSAMVVAQGGDNPELCVVRTARFTIDPGVSLSVVGGRPLVILASEYAYIDGILDVSSVGTATGPGGGARGAAVTPVSPGTGGTGVHAGTYHDGGGGGGGLCGAGGVGGDADSTSGGTSGVAASASWDLTPLRGGWGGGRGGSGGSAGLGGGGGGGVQVSVRGLLRVRGEILAGGGGGEGGLDGVSGDNNIGAGGGGGSGGAVLLEAEQVTFESGGFVRANGGGGGGAAGCSGRGDAADGEDGRDHVDRPAGGARGRSCFDGSNYGAAGGDGGGSPLDGENGASNGRANSNGAGGGGGAGCILIRNATASLPAGLSATSPTASPGLRAAMIAVD